MKGRIAEIFPSIQGEGLYAGEKQLFVRFFGCNLNRCKFCDTKLNSFIEYEPQELLNKIKLYQKGFHSISFTGGEPLLQKDFLKEVLKLTYQEGYKNYLETNGTLPEALRETIEYADIIAMDLKLPSSTGLDNFWEAHRRFLKIASQRDVFLKTVICQSTQEADLIAALNLIKEIDKSPLFLVLQPNYYENSDRLKEKLEKFKQICLKFGITTLIMPQLHKIVGVK